MAASDNESSHPRSESAIGHTESAPGACLDTDVLTSRLDEEVARAERHRTALSCLLVEVEDLRAIEQAHGRPFSERTLAYVGLALRREFRRFDRVGRVNDREFLVVLPGADGPRGEAVARRALQRLSAIKVETRGRRTTLHVAIALATWREGLDVTQLLAAARLAAGRDSQQSTAAGHSEPLGRRSVSVSSPADTPQPGGPLGFKDALRL
jgi:diguanylate cyclase (GGDEF)-like protein